MVSCRILAVCVLAGSSFAATAVGIKRVPYVANFTVDAEDNPYGNPPSFPGVYDDLYYSNIGYFFTQFNSRPAAGIEPHSPYWGAAWGYDFKTGYPNGQNNHLPLTSSISANYNNSKVVSFDLDSFWFGCSEGNITTIPPEFGGGSFEKNNPSNCTVTVKGYRLTSKALPGPREVPDAVVTFKYVPDPYPNCCESGFFLAEMKQFALPKTFTALRTVTFTISNKTMITTGSPNSTFTDPAGYMDDVKYTVLKRV